MWTVVRVQFARRRARSALRGKESQKRARCVAGAVQPWYGGALMLPSSVHFTLRSRCRAYAGSPSPLCGSALPSACRRATLPPLPLQRTCWQPRRARRAPAGCSTAVAPTPNGATAQCAGRGRESTIKGARPRAAAKRHGAGDDASAGRTRDLPVAVSEQLW